jgi:hypothetical protein
MAQLGQVKMVYLIHFFKSSDLKPSLIANSDKPELRIVEFGNIKNTQYPNSLTNKALAGEKS